MPTIWLLDLVDRPTYGVLQMTVLTYLLSNNLIPQHLCFYSLAAWLTYTHSPFHTNLHKTSSSLHVGFKILKCMTSHDLYPSSTTDMDRYIHSFHIDDRPPLFTELYIISNNTISICLNLYNSIFLK